VLLPFDGETKIKIYIVKNKDLYSKKQFWLTFSGVDTDYKIRLWPTSGMLKHT